MSLIKSNTAGLGGSGSPGGALGSFFSHTIDNSARFSDAANTNLIFTPGTPSSTSVWTMSVWMKKYNPDASGSVNEFFSAGGGSAYSFLSFSAANQQFLIANEQSGTKNKLWYNRKFRDPAAWFHLVLRSDLGESTQDDRLKLYINGELQTSTSDGLTMSSWSYINASGVTQNWGGKTGSANGNPGCDYYLADINFTDGQSYAPTEFGETKDGVWIPKDPSVTYGNNGYRLEFKQTGTGGASSSTIGADTSGNDNHFTDSGFSAHDIMPDSPTNNFATMNPLFPGNNATLGDGNLDVTPGGFTSSKYGTTSTFAIPKDKKIYLEVECTDQQGNYWTAGFATATSLFNGPGSSNIGSSGAIMMYNRSVMLNGTENDYGSSAGIGGFGVSKFATGDILGMAIDGATGKVWFSRNGTYFGAPQGHQSGAGATGDPAAGSNEIGTLTGGTTDDVFVVVSGNAGISVFVNFGQDSQNVSSAQSDGEGIGTFEYAPPTGYVALCASNLTTPAIGPTQSSQADDHFNTVLYTGNGGTLNVTGVGFQPDWVWLKSRASTRHHMLYDSVRGATKTLRSSLSNAEVTGSTTLTSFDSDGFSLGADSDVNTAESFVSWNWKAGGSASSNSNGSITSSVSANTDAGFSIGTFTGTGSAGTLGHGLSSAPEGIILKSRGSTANWLVFHKDITNSPTHIMFLDATNASTDQSRFNDTNPTSSVFSVGPNNAENQSGIGYVFYCFHGVEGYSKFGGYTGNGSSDGTFVFTGFRPAWVMVKRDSATENWRMQDSKRLGYNPEGKELYADLNLAEASNSFDMVSNGFKIRNTSNGYNASGSTYIYFAFAEAPFKFANAR